MPTPDAHRVTVAPYDGHGGTQEPPPGYEVMACAHPERRWGIADADVYWSPGDCEACLWSALAFAIHHPELYVDCWEDGRRVGQMPAWEQVRRSAVDYWPRHVPVVEGALRRAGLIP